MGLMDIIDAAAQRDIGLIHAGTKEKCAAIIRAAETEAETIIRESTHAADIARHKAILIAEAEAQSDEQTAESKAIDSLIQKLRESVFEKLDSVWMSEFVHTLSDMCAYGAHAVGSENIRISLVPRYESIFSAHRDSIMSGLAAQNITIINAAFDLTARGGIIIRSSDGRRIRTETYEESFRRIEDDVRIEFAERFCRE